jgi:D-3-phosphoglycerate dehydrogenase / 2-oxoglutarate reductase
VTSRRSAQRGDAVYKVLVVQPLHAVALALLDARDDVEYMVVTDVSESNLLAHVGEADALTLRDAPLPISVVRAGTRLRVISRHGVGYDNVPIDTCTALGIPVTLVGPVNAVSVAEHTMMLMLAAARVAIELDSSTRRGDFAVRGRVRGVELKGRTLLLVGYGRIGQEVAARAAAFGMRIVAVDPYVTPGDHAGVEFAADLDGALVEADVVSLHVPLTDETRNLIDRRRIGLMRTGAILVNASRGGTVDEAALLDSIRAGHLHGAGIDTFASEPLPADSPLLAERRIVLSPHAAALTEEALIAMGVATVNNALAALDGRLDPELVVNRSVLASVG